MNQLIWSRPVLKGWRPTIEVAPEFKATRRSR
jgi:hypothetical protein